MLMNSIVTLDDLAQVVHYPTHDMQALNRRPKRVVLVNISHTRSEYMLKYWAKSRFVLLHVSTQQKIVAPIRVLPAYSQTLPK